MTHLYISKPKEHHKPKFEGELGYIVLTAFYDWNLFLKRDTTSYHHPYNKEPFDPFRFWAFRANLRLHYSFDFFFFFKKRWHINNGIKLWAQTNAQTDKLIRFSLQIILTGLDGIPFHWKIKEFRHLYFLQLYCTTTWILISRQNWNGFLTNASHQIMTPILAENLNPGHCYLITTVRFNKNIWEKNVVAWFWFSTVKEGRQHMGQTPR